MNNVIQEKNVMQNKVAIGILTVLVIAGLGWSALLGYKVNQLEKP